MIPGPLRADCPPHMHPLSAAVWSPYWVVNAVEIQKFGGARVYRFWFESAPPFRVEVNQIISACSVVGCTGVWFRFPLRRSYRSSSCGSIGVLPTGIGVGGRRGRA